MNGVIRRIKDYFFGKDISADKTYVLYVGGCLLIVLAETSVGILKIFNAEYVRALHHFLFGFLFFLYAFANREEQYLNKVILPYSEHERRWKRAKKARRFSMIFFFFALLAYVLLKAGRRNKNKPSSQRVLKNFKAMNRII